MYMFTDRQKAELFDAGVTIDDVASYHGTDDHAWQSADEAFETLLDWYTMDDDRDGDRDIPVLHSAVDDSHADGSWAIPF